MLQGLAFGVDSEWLLLLVTKASMLQLPSVATHYPQLPRVNCFAFLTHWLCHLAELTRVVPKK